MTQEDKQLLYKDLAARQPYRPFICFAGKITMPFLDVIASTKSNELMSINGLSPDEVKPYLRPISSMTEEEKEDFGVPFTSEGLVTLSDTVECMDWLLAHHFDFRGLIEKGLALKAPEGMYEIK